MTVVKCDRCGATLRQTEGGPVYVSLKEYRRSDGAGPHESWCTSALDLCTECQEGLKHIVSEFVSTRPQPEVQK